MSIPHEWTTQQGQQSTVISNVSTLSPMEDGRLAESAFRVRLMRGVNAQRWSIERWFDAYFKNGFDGPINSKKALEIDGRMAIAVEVFASGQWTMIYIPVGEDVVALSYQTGDGRFIQDYNAIVKSVRITR